MKALHREILLSSTYQMSTEFIEADFAKDPENRLLWRANRRRLDIEALRDEFLADSGALDLTPGGPAKKLTDDNKRRTVYGFVSRRKLDGTLALFDFPNPNSTSEQRMDTNVPLQRLFFLNSGFIAAQAKLLAERLQPLKDDAARIDASLRAAVQPSAHRSRTQTGAGLSDRRRRLAAIRAGSVQFERV